MTRVAPINQREGERFISQAQAWKDRLDGFRVYITSETCERLIAKDLAISIKNDLEKEVRELQRKAKRGNVSTVEYTYGRMLHSVMAYFNIRVNSNPKNWTHKIGYVKVDLTHFMVNTKDWLKKAREQNTP